MRKRLKSAADLSHLLESKGITLDEAFARGGPLSSWPAMRAQLEAYRERGPDARLAANARRDRRAEKRSA